LYRASEHGFLADSFHSKCDNHANTLTLIKTANGFIFGGYTQQLWNASSSMKTDQNAFIFSLVNKDSNPIKMRVNIPEKAIACASFDGPTFGRVDFYISGHSNSNKRSSSNLGSSYQHSTYARGTNEARCFLAGYEYFQVAEIEVFKGS
jgi:hypothetical protein